MQAYTHEAGTGDYPCRRIGGIMGIIHIMGIIGYIIMLMIGMICIMVMVLNRHDA
jgi:hypothetical protein